MHKKFEKHRTKIKGVCQSGRKAVTHNSKSDLPLGKHKKMRRNLPVLSVLVHVEGVADAAPFPEKLAFALFLPLNQQFQHCAWLKDAEFLVPGPELSVL